ncbi:MAG: hypothetical protein JSR55_10420 [Proteobacteria bacterium]|nr:hypothetical protein [Pseudomonadota bacterium]
MHSLPVGDTIARAWGFAGRRIVPLLGVGWLAAVFYGMVVTYFLTRLSDAMLVWPRPDAGSFNNFALFYLFCLVVVTAFANAAMALPMMREALEPGDEWRSAYFVIARREWALFANLLLLYVIVIGMVSAIAFAGNVGIAVSLPMIGHDGAWQGIPLAPAMAGVLAFIAVATGLFLATRFGFFLASIAVADPPVRLLQSWSLSSGNFWRLLAIGLALFVPIIVLSLVTDWAMFGSQFGDAAAALFSPSHDKTALFQMVRNHAGTIAAIWAGALLLLNAIFAGASAAAYRRIGRDAASTREYVATAEPAFAMPTATPHLGGAERRRVEPEFTRTKDVEALEERMPEAKASEVVTAPVEMASVEPLAAEASEPVAAMPQAKPVTEPAPIVEIPAAEPAVITSIVPQEEPLAAHKDEIPALDPLNHAAPAEPDPSGMPEAIPLPSFVKTQSSPAREPSEAA